MLNSNVRAINTPVNPSVDDVCAWVRQKSERGEIPTTSARLKITALHQLVSILADDEPRDAAWVLEHISDITRRWATLNSAMKGDTAKTYESRGKGALEDYFDWAKDPTGFKFKRRDATQRSEPEERKRRGEPKPEAAPVGAPPPPPVSDARTFPLGPEKGVFKFTLPETGITVRDAKKIACHLLTLASDFDLEVPSHAQVFAMVLRDDK